MAVGATAFAREVEKGRLSDAAAAVTDGEAEVQVALALALRAEVALGPRLLGADGAHLGLDAGDQHLVVDAVLGEQRLVPVQRLLAAGLVVQGGINDIAQGRPVGEAPAQPQRVGAAAAHIREREAP